MERHQITRLLIIFAVLVIAVAQPVYLFTSPGGVGSFSELFTLGLDLKGGYDLTLEANPPPDYTMQQGDMEAAMQVVRNRIDPQGTRDVSITKIGQRRLRVQIPGVVPEEQKEDPTDLTISDVRDLLGSTAQLEFIDPRGQRLGEGQSIEGKDFDVVMTGKHVASASQQPHQQKPGQFIVSFELTDEGARLFREFTRRNVGRPFCIALDKQIVSCPTIQSAITQGAGMIENSSWTTPEGPSILARKINAGRLPVPLEVVQGRFVGPTLGMESLQTSLQAGLIGFGIVLIYMVFFYKIPGMVADIALVLYGVLVMGFISLFGITLTLPGIAGLILSLGMAVDANVIIFERLREEIQWGKSVAAAVESGFNRALVAIVDGNTTTILLALMLIWLGTGPIRGFAITLSLGILISFFSAIYVTRFLVDIMVNQGVKEENYYA